MARPLALMPALILAAALPLAGTAARAQAAQAPAVMPVDGPVVSLSVTEEVESTPDMATVGTGVQTRAMTAKEAMRLNAVAMDKLIAAISKTGVAKKDVQTSGINLNPQYDYSNRKDGEGPRFTGYEASNQLTVKIRKIADVGDTIDAMVGAGATNINGPTFGIQDDAPLIQQAKVKAIASAKVRAEFYAQQTGYRTVKLLSLSENGEIARPVPMVRMMMRADAAAAPKTAVEPGQLTTSVTLNVQYVLVP